MKAPNVLNIKSLRADDRYYFGVKNINIIDGIAEAIPLEGKSVDLITSKNGINNTVTLIKTFSSVQE